ncbi:MAG: sulfatase-like hydrolase/transferase [Armatimonadetes bacterium]|nr:sulfatase-like hydrolase/transferase [Armatimonadota bacterium]
MQTRREFLKRTGAVAAGMALGGLECLAADSGRKPNVIFVFADQLRAQALGCYGDKQAVTPNIDRLASQGARFTNAISTWPVCSPFRAMLMTGCYPMTNGVVYNDLPIWDGQTCIADALKAQGYATGYIGKWHLSGGIPDRLPGRRLGFDYWEPSQVEMISTSADGKQTWRPEVQTDKAVEYIKSNKDKPFCLFMSWNPPHNPYIAPDRYMKSFEKDKMEFRTNVAERALVDEQLEKHPTDEASGPTPKRAKWRKDLDSDDGVREILWGYYSATHGLDVLVGRIMKTLDDLGIADDTILVFSSDHGDMLGSHRMCLKQEPFEESISIPFIVRYPKRIPKGTVTDALLSPIDIMPTLLSLAGAPVPKSVEGISLDQAALGKRSDQQDAVLIMKMQPGGGPWVCNAATPWRGVRTKTHTYARLEYDGPWILFDNKNDPYQMKNLIGDPAHKKLQDEMEATMQKLLKKANDPFDSGKIKQQIARRSRTNLRMKPREARGEEE